MGTTGSEGAGVGEKLFRLALRALPKAFRDRYGEELLAFHRERLRESDGSPWARTKVWGSALRDLAQGALLERARQARAHHGGARSARPGPGLAFDLLFQDVRFALRGLARAPGFTSIAVLSLAIGIGAFSATFVLVQETWLEPVPGVTHPDEVVEILVTRHGSELDAWSYPDFEDARDADTPLRALVAWKDRDGTLGTAQGGERVRMMSVSADYFRTLGVALTQGRDFSEAEDQGPGQHPVAVVSHEMWRDRLGADPGILGRVLTLNQAPYTVVGVAPEGFRDHRILKGGTEVWVPLAQDPWITGADALNTDRGFQWLRVLGRLEAGATVERANAALANVFDRLAEANPETNEGRSATAYPFGPVPAMGRAESLLGISAVFGLLGLVLLIICGNVTGMVLARSVAREQELAVRMALGCGRRSLARLLLFEALVLAVLGGGLGLLLGVWGMGAAYALIPGAPAMDFRVQGPLVGVALALTLTTALGVGLLPAARFSRPGLVSSLKEDGGGGGRRAGRIHRIAVSAQAGVALVLLVFCSLFLRSLGVMAHKDLGFEPRNLLTTRIDLTQLGYATAEEAGPFLDEIRERVGALPGVASVSLADGLPLDLVGNFARVSRSDAVEQEGGGIQVEFTRADERFFGTVGTPLLQGSGFGATGDVPSEPVVVITESVASRLWPGEDPVGRRLRTGVARDPEKDYTVVGVVPNVASSRAAERWPNVFLHLRQSSATRVMVLVRSVGDEATVSRAVREALLELEPALPYPAIVPSPSLVERSTQGQRMGAKVAGALGVLALLLSALGVYGVVAFSVSCRTREIGLRMAMGATRDAVLRGVFRDAVNLAVPGLVVGGLLAVAGATVLRAELLGLGPTDPFSFLAATALLVAVVVLASLVPARRASAVDPMTALGRR